LPDPAVFDSQIIEEIHEDLGQLGLGSEEMEFDEENEDFFDRIINRVIEWCRKHPQPVPLAKNPNLNR
jgi:hypothetical protein